MSVRAGTTTSTGSWTPRPVPTRRSATSSVTTTRPRPRTTPPSSTEPLRTTRTAAGDACLDVDVELSAGDELEEPRELVRGGGRHDAGDPDVVAAELLGVAPSVDATVPPARIT